MLVLPLPRGLKAPSLTNTICNPFLFGFSVLPGLGQGVWGFGGPGRVKQKWLTFWHRRSI